MLYRYIICMFSLVLWTLCSIFRSDWLVGSNFGVPGINASFDYVVIGGGTAGLVVATRLAQHGSFSVAVIEAGGFNVLENSNLSQIPAFAINSALQNSLEGVNPLIDWRFETTPQSGINNRILHYARGKCLGGSSTRNNLVYNQATIGTMSKWADEVDDTSYLWENIEPYYKTSSHFTTPNENTISKNVSIEYNQTMLDTPHGPVDFGYTNYIYAIGSYASEAFTELGIDENQNSFASGELIGHQYNLMTVSPHEQTRSSSETAYLTLALEQTSLVVYTHTFASKIIFDSKKTATSVLVEAGGVSFEISANKEIILSAGAFQSPQLLMVSGIGPSDVLKQYGISVIADRPGVGSNLQDNIAFGPSYEINLESAAIISSPEYVGQVMEEFLVQRTGPLTNPLGDYIGYDRVSGQSWANISISAQEKLNDAFPSDWPEVEWLVGASYLGGGNGPPDDKNYANIIAALTASLSRGNVTIQSADMEDPPLINPNWLTDPVDQEMVVAAFRHARALFHAQAMQRVVIGEEVDPGEDVSTDAEILEYIKSNCLTIYHACCTSAMGKRNDQMAVVDSQAKVIGVNGLRVVDVSALPFLPPGQPQGTIYMLAEKIAADILDTVGEEEWFLNEEVLS